MKTKVICEGTMKAHIYETDNGEFVVADQAGWLPGSFSSEDEALASARAANGLT